MLIHQKKLILSFIAVFISTYAIGQDIEFKLIKAIKSQELIMEDDYSKKYLTRTEILPDDKRHLIIMAEVNNPGAEKIRTKKEDISLEEGNKVLGYLRETKRANTGWPSFATEIKEGKNLFSAIFIVDKSLKSTAINIGGQSFDITGITDAPHSSLICIPKVTPSEKEYVKEIAYDDKYSRDVDYQVITEKITPYVGQFLKLKVELIYCDDVEHFRNKPFAQRPDYFQLQDASGAVFECVGTLNSVGKFSSPTNGSLRVNSKNNEIKWTYRLVFNVPKEGKYKLKYLDQVISDI
ncbi:MAG: hypothetical protein AAFX87_14625 [Bacteroidota bacterium]